MTFCLQCEGLGYKFPKLMLPFTLVYFIGECNNMAASQKLSVNFKNSTDRKTKCRSQDVNDTSVAAFVTEIIHAVVAKVYNFQPLLTRTEVMKPIGSVEVKLMIAKFTGARSAGR